MRRRFHRRARAAWAWASPSIIQITGGNTTNDFGYTWLLPPGRVEWLLDNQLRRNSFTVKRILVWAYYSWTNTDGNNSAIQAPTQELFIIKSREDALAPGPGGDTAFKYLPYAQPPLPGSITSSWDEALDTGDGLDPYLWTGVLPNPTLPIPASPATNVLSYPTPWPYITGEGIVASSQLGCEAGYGVNTPTHDITVKRKLAKGEGILFGCHASAAFNTNLTFQVALKTRVLVG